MAKLRFKDILQNLSFSDKQINWGYKFWCCCASETGYLHQFDLYFGKKKDAKENLVSGVVLKMTASLQNIHCMFCCSFFNSSSLMVKVYERGLYFIGTA